jgi:hypothetical protein
MNNVDNNIKQHIQPVGGEKMVVNQASKNKINTNLKIPRIVVKMSSKHILL